MTIKIISTCCALVFVSLISACNSNALNGKNTVNVCSAVVGHGFQRDKKLVNHECYDRKLVDRDANCPSLGESKCLVNWAAVNLNTTEEDVALFIGQPTEVKTRPPGRHIWSYEMIVGLSATLTMEDGKVIEFKKPEELQTLYHGPILDASATSTD